MTTHSDVMELRDAAAQAGEVLYREQIGPVELKQEGRLVAIHIPTGEYFLGDSIIEVTDKLRQNHPNAAPGEVYTRRIGQRGVFNAQTPRVDLR